MRTSSAYTVPPLDVVAPMRTATYLAFSGAMPLGRSMVQRACPVWVGGPWPITLRAASRKTRFTVAVPDCDRVCRKAVYRRPGVAGSGALVMVGTGQLAMLRRYAAWFPSAR